jgi:hypothetical protein
MIVSLDLENDYDVHRTLFLERDATFGSRASGANIRGAAEFRQNCVAADGAVLLKQIGALHVGNSLRNWPCF